MRGDRLRLGVVWLFDGRGLMVMILGDSVLSWMAALRGTGLGPLGPASRLGFVVPGSRPSLLLRCRCCP